MSIWGKLIFNSRITELNSVELFSFLQKYESTEWSDLLEEKGITQLRFLYSWKINFCVFPLKWKFYEHCPKSSSSWFRWSNKRHMLLLYSISSNCVLSMMGQYCMFVTSNVSVNLITIQFIYCTKLICTDLCRNSIIYIWSARDRVSKIVLLVVLLCHTLFWHNLFSINNTNIYSLCVSIESYKLQSGKIPCNSGYTRKCSSAIKCGVVCKH